jgi:hypothetical protein
MRALRRFSIGRGRKGTLRKRLRASTTYQVGPPPPFGKPLVLTRAQEWKDAAESLDEFLEFDDWKQTDEDPFYDWRLIRKVRIFVITLVALTRTSWL